MWTHQQRRPLRRGAGTLAVLALVCAPALAGCSATTSSADAGSPATSATVGGGSSSNPSSESGTSTPTTSATSKVPLPSPTGRWTPASRKAAKGPTAPAPVPTRSAALTAPVTFDSLVTVHLTSVTATTVTGRTPGENSGPAVKVTLTVRNGSTAPIDVSSAVVSLKADKRAVGVGTTAGDPHPLQGRVSPKATVTGTYVFMLAPAKARHVVVSVNYAAGEPVAVFTGRTA